MCDGVHLGQEDGRKQDPGHGKDGDCHTWVVEWNRCKVVNDRPGHKDGDDEDGRTSYPPALVEVSLHLQYRHGVEEGEEEQGGGINVKQEEPGHADPTLRITINDLDANGPASKIPLNGNDHLDHDHEEQRK